VSDVKWSADNTIRPGFEILAGRVEAGVINDEPMIVGTTYVGTTYVGFQLILELYPITKRKIGGRKNDKDGGGELQVVSDV
jgi:hypothetical protein